MENPPQHFDNILVCADCDTSLSRVQNRLRNVLIVAIETWQTITWPPTNASLHCIGAAHFVAKENGKLQLSNVWLYSLAALGSSYQLEATATVFDVNKRY